MVVLVRGRWFCVRWMWWMSVVDKGRCVFVLAGGGGWKGRRAAELHRGKEGGREGKGAKP